jgi:hypothetical protein
MRQRGTGGGLRRSAALWRYVVTAVLGLPRRPLPAAPPRRNGAASSFEAPLEAANALQFERAYWLSPFGRGNGLEALFWVPLAEVPDDGVDAVLVALEREGIAAWAAPLRGRPRRAERASAVSVGADRLDDAGNVLIRVLADSTADRGGGSGPAREPRRPNG